MPSERETGDSGDWKIISLRGAIDFDNARTVWNLLLESVAGSSRILVDLSDVSHLGSSGVVSLAEAHRMARQNGARLELVGVNRHAMRMLELSRLSEVLKIRATGARPPRLG